MHQMSDEEFERAIEEALDGLPPQFLEALENVAVVWEEEPSAYHLGYEGDEWGDGAPWSEADDEGFGSWDAAAVNDGLRDATGDERDGEGGLSGDRLPDDLLGLFDGLSLVERADGYEEDGPAVITVFKGPHERCFGDRDEIVTEIGKTIIHELGHYFGLDEDQLAAMGYE